MADASKPVKKHGLHRRELLALGGGALSYLGLGGTLRAAPGNFDVAIIGAGLAGLYSAILLRDLGASVVVLEAADRAGGRCLTADTWAHTPDLGASQVGASYARIYDMCRRFDVKLGPGSHVNAPYTPVLRGRMIPAATWSESEYNLTEGAERDILPHALLDFYIGRRTPFGEDVSAWSGEAAAQYDMSIDEWLQRQGASKEAMRIMYEATGRTPLGERSVLRMLQESTRGKVEMKKVNPEQRAKLDHYEIASIISSHIIGGTSRIIDAMAAELGDDLRLDSAVAAIDQTGERCAVRLANGETVKADFVVTTLPFSVLRDVAFDPPLAGAQADAVANMPYNNQSQIWFEIKEPYWEADGLGASMATDGPLQYVRQQIKPDGSRELMSAIASAEKAAYLDSLPPAERGAFALQEIERIRPSTQGKLEVIGVHSWSGAGGCSFEFPVGSVHAWANAMSKPHGQVHFAGEHLRELELGMEAAMESGQRAALEIAERMLA